MTGNPFSSANRSTSRTSDSKDGTKQESLIIRFYDPYTKAPDAHGRTHEDILAWQDAYLEHSHNYIQILFPLPEGSPYNYAAPVIDREVMEAFRARPELRNQLRRSLVRILDFYGFKAVGDESAEKKEGEVREKTSSATDDATEKGAMSAPDELTVDEPQASTNAQEPPPIPSTGLISGFTVIRGPQWSLKSGNWCIRFDHNHLRITRILRCLRVLGLEKECDAFYSALNDVFNDPDIRISSRSFDYWTKAVDRPLYIAPDDDRIGWLRKWEEEAGKLQEQ